MADAWTIWHYVLSTVTVTLFLSLLLDGNPVPFIVNCYPAIDPFLGDTYFTVGNTTYSYLSPYKEVFFKFIDLLANPIYTCSFIEYRPASWDSDWIHFIDWVVYDIIAF